MLLPMCAIANDSIPVTYAAKTEISKKAGDDAYSKGKFSEAVGVYEVVIKEKGATKQLYYNLGVVTSSIHKQDLLGHLSICK